MARVGRAAVSPGRWRQRRDLLRALASVAVRRFRQNTRLSLTLLVGAVLATGLAAATPIYLDAIRDLGLSRMIDEAPPGSLDLTYEQSGVLTDEPAVSGIQQALDEEVSGAAGRYVGDPVTVVQTSTFVMRRPAEPFSATGSGAKGFFAWHSEFARFVDGPAPPVWDGTGPLRVVMLRELAERLGVEAGDEFLAQPFWLPAQNEVTVEVVALVDARPDAVNDPAAAQILRGPAGTENQLRFWAPRASVVDALPRAAPQLRSLLSVRYPTKTGDLNGDDAAHLDDRLAVLQTRVGQRLPDVRQGSALPTLLRDFDERYTFAEGTLLIVALQLIGALLLYLVITSAMVATERTGDVAWLRSRGAARRQTIGLQLMEAGMITVPAVALGPLVGLGVVSLLGLVPPFDAFADGPFISPRLSALAWGLAALTGLLALLAQFVPTYVAARESVVTERRLRGRPGPSGLQRLAVDASAIGIAGVLIYQLQRDPAPVDSPIVGETSIDVLTAATPAVLVFVVGLVVLRLFPVVLRAAAHLGMRGMPASAVLSMLYLSRAPTPYGRMVVLLLVTASLAVFTASFDTTLERSYDERSAYAAGADVRVVEPLANTVDVARLRRVLTEPEDPVASAVVGVERFDGRLAGEASLDVTLMTTDAADLASAAFFRDDFAAAPLAETLAGLAPPLREQPFEIDEASGRLVLWMRPLEARPGTAVVARLRDAVGRYWDYVLGFMDDARPADDPARRTQPDDPAAYRLRNGLGETVAVGEDLAGWQRLEQLLFNPNWEVTIGGFQPTNNLAYRPQGPLTLSSVGIRIAGRRPFTRGAVLFDALTWERGGESLLLTSFEEPDAWTQTPTREDGTLDTLVASDEAFEGMTALEFSWDGDAADRLRGVRLARTEDPVPAVVSAEMLDRARTRVGGGLVVTVGNLDIDLLVAATFDLFPTFDPEAGDGLVIVDRTELTERVMEASTIGLSRGAVREVWIATDSPSAALATLDADQGDVVVAAQEREAIAVDPLVAAGWNGIFAGAMVAVTVAVGFGLITLTLTLARARRVEFALLRSLGVSAGGLLRLVALELTVVVGLGLGAGLLLGVLGGGVFLDFFAVTPEGGDVLPPLLYEVNWRVVGFVFAGLGGFLALNVVLALLILRRTDIQAQLRLGL